MLPIVSIAFALNVGPMRILKELQMTLNEETTKIKLRQNDSLIKLQNFDPSNIK